MDAPVCGSPFGRIPRPLYRVRSVVPIRRELWIYFLNGARGRRLKLRRRFVSAAPVGRRARLPIRRSLPRNQSGPWPQHVLPTSKRACTTSSVKLSPPAAHGRTAQIRISGRSDPLPLIPFGVLHSAARVLRAASRCHVILARSQDPPGLGLSLVGREWSAMRSRQSEGSAASEWSVREARASGDNCRGAAFRQN